MLTIHNPWQSLTMSSSALIGAGILENARPQFIGNNDRLITQKLALYFIVRA